MGFQDSIRTVFGKYADFSGRAARPEYWWWYLFTIIVAFGMWLLFFVSAMLLGDTNGLSIISIFLLVVWFIVELALIIPSLAVLVRRLHDTDRSAVWLLLIFIPFGSLVLIILAVLPGDSGTNRYGPAPGGSTDPLLEGPNGPMLDAHGNPVTEADTPRAMDADQAPPPAVANRPAGLPRMPQPPILPNV